MYAHTRAHTYTHTYTHTHTHTHTCTQLEHSSDSSGSSGSGGPEEAPYGLDPSLHSPDVLAFNTALVELRVIVGEEASEELLRDLLLAADMDINRAVNYYLNTIT